MIKEKWRGSPRENRLASEFLKMAVRWLFILNFQNGRRFWREPIGSFVRNEELEGWVCKRQNL